jgi:hydroxymethylbilane synthase
LATRGSPLARWQAERVVELLGRHGVVASLVVVETIGDQRTDVPLDQLGGQGVFVKEVQAAVVRGDADAAVHSAKDLPSAPELAAPGLVLAAFPERADTRDLLVGATLATLPTGATVATGSARRRAQLANLRPDLTFAGLRGNLAARLSVAGTGTVAAVVVAKAAVDRLGWSPPPGQETEVLGSETMVPQVGQGALAIECRADDDRTLGALAAINDPEVEPLVVAERAYLAALGGGCTLPVGASARWLVPGSRPDTAGTGRALELAAVLAAGDGGIVLRRTGHGSDPIEVGRSVARFLLDDAGGSDLGEWSPLGPEVGW